MGDITATPSNNGIPGAIEMPPGTNATSIDENGTAKNVQGQPVGQVSTADQPALAPPPGFSPAPAQSSPAKLAPPPGFKPVQELAPPSGFKKVGASGVVSEDTDPNRGASQATGLSARETGFHSWLQDLQNDVRNGTDNTWFGAMYKKMGNKGGGDPGQNAIAGMINPLIAIPEGLAKLGEGGIEFLRQSKAVMDHVAAGDSFSTAVMKASIDDPQLLKKAQIGANKVVGGAFQAIGPVTAVAVPEATLAAAPAITTGMVAQHVASKTAKAMGADDDTAEMVGNIAALGTAHAVNEKINPLTKRFGAAVNDRTAAETEYTNRVRNVETARGQQAEAQQRAQAAAQAEAAGTGKPEDTVAARQLANDAAKNVSDAQKAADVATKNRADSIVQVEKLHRQIMESANKSDQEFMDRFTSDSEKAKDLFEKAVPSKGAHQYDDEDYDVWRAHIEQAKQGGASIKNLPDAYNATEAQRQGIESRLDPAVEKIGKNPITTNPFIDTLSQLGDIAKIKPEVLDVAADELSRYNLKDLTVGEARDTIKQLNNENRAAMKGASNWDVSEMIATDPRFAARYLAAKSLREGFYQALEDAGVKGAKEARGEEASLIQMKEAIGAQIRANRGGTAIRGSGEQGKLRGLIAKLTRKTIVGAATAEGAKIGGPAGAVAGGAFGDALAEPVENAISARDMTRDEHIDKSMQYRGTLRQPIRIEGIDNAAVNRPATDLPPEVKAQLPTAVPKVPRENTELHAELASHYLENIGDSTYQELEDRLKKDIAVKKANDPTIVTPAEKTLFSKINKFDAQDAAANAKAAEDVSSASTAARMAPTKEAKAAENEIKIAAAAKAGDGRPASEIEINPVLRAQGRGNESALVSHSPAMKAHAEPMQIEDLPEGITSEDAHREEWAHTAIGAVDGLDPIEIRSDLHPKTEKGSAATTAFDASQIKDENGKYDPEALETQLTQWLTQKMAGPASHEVFRGATRDELKAGAGNRSDFREARALVREVHPDFNAAQVEEVIDSAYDRAHDFLTKPHIADRIRANASVREEGLPDTHHASHGRVNQFAEDIRKAHDNAEGNDAGPNGSGAGEGSEKPEKKSDSGTAERDGKPDTGKAKDGEKKNAGRDKGGSEGEPRADDETGTNTSGPVKEARVSEESANISRTPESAQKRRYDGDEATRRLNGKQEEGSNNGGVGGRGNEDRTGNVGAGKGGTATGNPPKIGTNEVRIPPERSTGNPESDAAIKAGGGIPGGSFGDELAMFHSPQTGSTLALKHADVSPERVKAHIKASDDTFGPEQKIAPEENSQARKSSDEVYKGIARTYGVHDDPKVERTAGFITPDARYIDLPVDHTQAIEDHGGGKAGGAKDNRQDFINDTGAIRVHKARERGGSVLAFSVPKDGVTPEQVEAMQRSVGANGDRNGILRMERADISPETRNTLSTEQEFPSASNVKPMLQKINALREETSNANKGEKNEVAKGADEFNKERGREPVVPGTTHSPEVAKRIADAFDQMKHDPENPAVKASYDALKHDVDDQWNYATQKMGMKFEPWDKEGQPYANSKEMAADVNNNHHLSFFRGGELPSDHPMREVDPETGFNYNEKLRAVHDLFGHAANENQFGPKGEENAWNEHRQMFSPEALPAITSETRGQNSWVNFGKHLRDAEGNIPTKGQEGYVPPTERPYAQNKAGILPEEFQKPNGAVEVSNANKKGGPAYPENPEGFEHIHPKLLDLMEPDEKAFVKGSKSKQTAIQKAYDGIQPTMDETKAAIEAGGALGGWWQRFIDTFKALGEPTEATKIQQLGPEHAEALKAWHSAVSGNKSVEDANRTAWGTYADWLDAGRPKDRETINKIVAANGKPKGNAAISDTFKNGKLIGKGLDTTKLYSLINSPQMRDVNPEPFHGSIYDPANPSPVAGVTNGARKIPSMAATVAGKGNLNRLVLDAHMLDFYGQNGWTDNKYIAHSLHLRDAAKQLGLSGGEAQEQIWGTVLGIKQLLREGVPSNEIPSELTNDVVKGIGKDYADIIREDPELNGIFEQLKKHGIDPGGNRAQQRLADITTNKPAVKEAGANKDLLAHTAERIKGKLKNLPESADTSFKFGNNAVDLTKNAGLDAFGKK